MGGTTKVDVGICRVWVYLDDQATKNVVAGVSIASIITGLCDPEMVSKIVVACANIACAIMSSQNHGNGVIIKIPHVLGVLAARPAEICGQ